MRLARTKIYACDQYLHPLRRLQRIPCYKCIYEGLDLVPVRLKGCDQ